MKGRPWLKGLIGLMVIPALLGCASDEETISGNSVPLSSIALPNLQSPSLHGLETASPSSLNPMSANSTDCDTISESTGVFGLALGAACHILPLAGNAMMHSNNAPDTNGDGAINCADYNADNNDLGFVFHLLCHPLFVTLDNVTSVANDQSGDSMGISFATVTGGDGVGSWSHGNTSSYPADIRMWVGSTLTSLNNLLYLDLVDINNGILHFDFGVFQQASSVYPARIEFSNKTDTSSCVSTPSTSTCHWQDVRIHSGEGSSTFGPPNGFHMRALFDDHESPQILVLEGFYRYTAGMAQNAFGSGLTLDNDSPSFATDIRRIYVKTVQKGSQLWGSFRFMNESSQLLDWRMSGTNVSSLVADGYCQNIGNSSQVTCTDITPSDYDSVWLGESSMTIVDGTTLTLPEVFSNPPTSDGVQLAQ